MAKQIVIERPNGTVTIVRSELETTSEDPLTVHEQIINELYDKVKNLGVVVLPKGTLCACGLTADGTLYGNPMCEGCLHRNT